MTSQLTLEAFLTISDSRAKQMSPQIILTDLCYILFDEHRVANSLSHLLNQMGIKEQNLPQ